MSTAQLCTVSNGYKPHVTAELLGITRETLRYWRAHLDPHPQRHHYSGGILFAYRIVKSLIRYKHLPVETLAQCAWVPLFDACDAQPIGQWRERVIVVDEKALTVTWQAATAPVDDNNLFLQRLPLRPVLAEHMAAFSTLGAPPVRPQPQARVARSAPVDLR